MMRWIHRLVLPLWAAIACLAAQAAPPETLTLVELSNHPERWPAKVTLKKAFRFADGSSTSKGQSVRVLEFDGREVRVEAAANFRFKISPQDCDLLEAANEVWKSLTPAQRAVEPVTLETDPSLWPPRVQLLAGIEFTDGGSVASGTEAELISVENGQLRLYAESAKLLFKAPPSWTDVISRARERVLQPPAQRPSRIAAALRGKLVKADGRPDASSAPEEAQLFLLYFGASWCGPCREFSPTLVRFVNEAQKKNRRLCVVMLSNDKEASAMYEYMRAEKMPWPAVPFTSVGKTPQLSGFEGRGIPKLVVLDRHGKILANSYSGEQYLGPNHTLGELEKLLDAGLAR